MLPWRLWLLTLLTLSCLTFPGTLWAQSTVTIGIVDNNIPYSDLRDGTASGFTVDVLREMADNVNLNLEFQAGNWPEIYSAFMNGHIDVLGDISFSNDRADQILFTEPYHTRQILLMHNSSSPLGHTRTLDALAGKHLGVLREVFYRNALNDADVTLTTYDSVSGLIRALAFGWVDGIIGPGLTLEYYARDGGFPFLKIAGPAPMSGIASEDFRLGVSKDNESLLRQLQRGLDAIPDEKVTQLLQRWQEYGGSNLNPSGRLVLNAQTRHYLSQLGPIRVGFMKDYAPFSFQDAGALQGLSVDIMNRVADLTGLHIVPVSGHWSELYPAFVDGNIDVMANMSKTEERAAFIQFSEPYHTIPNVAFTLDPQLEFEHWSELAGKRIALGAGIYYEKALRDQLGDKVRSFTSQRAMFEALVDGSVDVTLVALSNGNHWVRTLQIPAARIAGEITFENAPGEDLRFGARQPLATVTAVINQALDTITPTEMATIQNRWLGASYNQQAEQDTVTFTQEEQKWLASRGHRLTLCADPDWLPMEGLNESKELIGVSASLFELFRQRTDIRFDPLPVESWEESLIAAREGDCDLMSMAMRTPERQAYLNFTDPYLQLPSVMVGRVESPFVAAPSELGNQPIGIVRGYALSELLLSRHPDLNLAEVQNEHDGLRRVQNRELAAYISTLATANHAMQTLGLADLKVIGRISVDWTLSVATDREEPILHSIMQKLVNSLTEQEQQALHQAWNRVELEQTVDYTLLIQIMLLALVVLALLFYWNRKLGRLNAELETANNRLAHLSVTDELTQLGNRSYFDREFTASFDWCKRHRAGFAVAMIDADLFKVINDNYGHQAGDQCLKLVADRMRVHFRRETDRLSRFGGEEFTVFTTYSNADELTYRFEQLRKDIEDRSLEWEGKSISFTISIGLATGIPRIDSPQTEFLRQADQALYTAKQSGRNRLEVRSVGKTD